mmetsp:Transcript_1129/g.699  ORF Transcript_1129/g.699 Transcript_1129/m.699 type:complete len:436 (+) Transcript_1129:43-1350(+)
MWPVLIVVIALGVALYLNNFNRAVIPKHLTDYEAFAEDDLIPEEIARDLVLMMKNDFKDFFSNVDQAKAQGFTPTHEHIGEAQPILPDGTCAHPLLFPDMGKTSCILPQRIDIGKHYVLTGGLDGVKEKVSEGIDRLSSFARYTINDNIDKYPPVKKLFYSDKFQSAAKRVCPKNDSYLDTFQFSYIIQVPGQTVAMHLDSPYFWGASRFNFPQWLLVSMVFSNLFKDLFVDQIQVVGYLHDWKETKSDGGEFVYYLNSGNIGVVPPKYRSGTFVDGSKVLHAAKIYRPHVKAPHLSKDEDCSLSYTGNEEWKIFCGDRVVANYSTNDLRISIVYRARCFDSEQQAKEYENFQNSPDKILKLDYIVETFKKDLVTTKGFTRDALDRLSSLDFAFLIMNTYIQYPLPPKELAFFPWNYCAIPLQLPWTAPLFEYIC